MTAAHGDDSLQYSILYGLGFYLLSAAIYFVASRRLKRDWYRAALLPLRSRSPGSSR